MAQTRDPITSGLFTNGAAHVALKDSLAGPEGAAAGVAVALAGSDVETQLVCDAFDLYIPASVTEGVFIEIASAPGGATGSRAYGPGTYRFPITSGYYVVLQDVSTNGTVYLNPVA